MPLMPFAGCQHDHAEAKALGTGHGRLAEKLGHAPIKGYCLDIVAIYHPAAT
jgi:hypothetical protein